MVKFRFWVFHLWAVAILCSSYVSLCSDSFFINCGSTKNVSVDNRVFESDNLGYISSENSGNAIDSNSLPPGNDSVLHRTARVFSGRSTYNFPINQQGRFWIRLHFSSFVTRLNDLSTATFSVSAQNFTLLRDYQPGNTSVVKEYSLNITSDKLTLDFSPKSGSIAFINALEVFRLPEKLIPEETVTRGSKSGNKNLRIEAMETVARVNMGNLMVNRGEDKLWRFWDSDSAYLNNPDFARFVKNISVVHFTDVIKNDIAPADVYGTATILNNLGDVNTQANVTWNFKVDPGFNYFVRLHFCDILEDLFGSQSQLLFNVYINSLQVTPLPFSQAPNGDFGTPHFIDVVMMSGSSNGGYLNLSIGSTGSFNSPEAIINGFEIMKLSNDKRSLDVSDSVLPRNDVHSKSYKLRIGLLAGLSGMFFVASVLGLVAFVLCRRRKRRRLLQVVHSGADEQLQENGKGDINNIQFSSSKIGYRFPLASIKEATDNFSESLVIGVGGFGKVYKGTLRDNTAVAVKRGASKSQQGLAEFKTEIEMLSQFRHRHLVSFIGYCDENNELIIVYEYMENGTLRNHLYGSDNPSLSWRQRLEICIGSARGIHYLHTGSAKAIIHRDVKSANILLDKNFMAKVADFGLSKTGPDLDQTHVSTAVKGSFGYLDPEYLTRQQLTEKSDVYSFGVVMYEVLCGRPVIDPSLPRDKVNLIEWALKLQSNVKLEEFIDPSLEGQVKAEALNKYCEIAEKCLAQKGIDRPTMGDVLWNLECTLQLQVKDDKSGSENCIDQTEASVVSTTQFSMASVGDLAGVSMSKVFLKMVSEDDAINEETRKIES